MKTQERKSLKYTCLNLIEYHLTTLWWTKWDYKNIHDSWTCLVELHKLECIEQHYAML
jgi:hypothetical protein